MARTIPSVVSMLVLVGCADVGRSGPHYLVEDSAGVEFVHNLSSAVRFMDTREVLRIGSVSGSPETLFHNVGSIDVFRDGNILVTNAISAIREYSSDGRFIREYGREGEGPGEFGWLLQALCLGDTVVAFSVRPDRITLFSREGELLESFSPPPTPNPFRSGGQVVDHRVLFIQAPIPRDSGREVVRATEEYVEIDIHTGQISALRFSLPGPMFWGGGHSGPILDQGGSDAILPGKRYVVVPEEGYRLEVWTWSGELRRVVTRTYDPVPISQRDMDRFEEATRMVFRQAPEYPGLEQEIRDALERAPVVDHIPPILRVAAAEDGSLWVHRQDLYDDPFGFALALEGYADEGFELQPATYDHFDAGGRYTGSTRLPARFFPRKWGPDYVLGVERDELDVEFIVRLEVDWPESPSVRQK